MMAGETREIAVWLANQGFPYDWHTDVTAPAWLRAELVEVWMESEGGEADDWDGSMRDEQAWSDDRV